jgi:hypothetical protein
VAHPPAGGAPTLVGDREPLVTPEGSSAVARCQAMLKLCCSEDVLKVGGLRMFNRFLSALHDA